MTLWESVRGLARRVVAVTSRVVGQVVASVRAHGARTASVGVGAMLAGTSLWGLLRADLYPEPESVAAMFRGLDAVSLAVAAPTLLGAVWRSGHGSARAQLVWLAVLAYVTYTYLLYAFGLGWTTALPLHVTLVVLASVALMARLRRLDRDELARTLSGVARQRAAGVLLAVLGVGLGAMWAFYLGRYALTGQALPEAQLVQTSYGALLSAAADLVLLVPAYLVAALLLWRRSSWGHPVGAALLAAGLLQQVGYQAELFAQSASGIPGARAFDPAEPVIAALYVVGVALLFGRPQRALPLPGPPVGRRPALHRA
ncbi:MAG TPA: hypothetical protein VFL99_09500 [Segeticoccus sp.]|uniref:hypothetical protein n=1 Tax=Segeticoccus sp. TaxID=2706531 RepID=UPI002D805B16|nr:hypothetical protein [Segeticoccus sp.]HET8600550.1 hypothetical protein [Segeticoccus sp.]